MNKEQIHNQENCGERRGCSSLIDGSCKFMAEPTEPCYWDEGYESDDCKLNKHVQKRIEKDREMERANAKKK